MDNVVFVLDCLQADLNRERRPFCGIQSCSFLPPAETSRNRKLRRSFGAFRTVSYADDRAISRSGGSRRELSPWSVARQGLSKRGTGVIHLQVIAPNGNIRSRAKRLQVRRKRVLKLVENTGSDRNYERSAEYRRMLSPLQLSAGGRGLRLALRVTARTEHDTDQHQRGDERLAQGSRSVCRDALANQRSDTPL
jgi:hypothetical protein